MLINTIGIPCCHSFINICALCVTNKEMYLRSYKHIIYPTNGPKMWPKAKGHPIQPPNIRRQPGRPKKLRKKDQDKTPQDPTRLQRHHSTYKCTRCHKFGHNERSCKGKTRVDK